MGKSRSWRLSRRVKVGGSMLLRRCIFLYDNDSDEGKTMKAKRLT